MMPPDMRGLVAGIVVALTLGAAAQAHAFVFTPSWGYLSGTDTPFHDPSGAPLPLTQAYPRGLVKDGGVSDKTYVVLTVKAFSAADVKLYEYSKSDGNAVYRPYDQLIVSPSWIAYLVYDFCKANNSGCIPSHRIGRTLPPPPPPPGSDPPPPPPPPPDADRDGLSPPRDCDDFNSTIWPGARDVPGNGIDEDCSGTDLPGKVLAEISTWWAVTGKGVRVKRLAVSDAPSNATVVVQCLNKGCRFKPRSVPVGSDGAANVKTFFKGRLRFGTVLEVRVTAPNSIAKVRRYKMRRGRSVKVTKLCQPPGALKPGKC